MTLERLLEKRNTTNSPLTVVVDGISVTSYPIQNSSTQSHKFSMHSHINGTDNCDNCDCGNCYCACR